MTVVDDAAARPAADSETPVTPAAGAPRTWLRKIVGGGQILETCPEWCTADHEHDRRSLFDDLTHESATVSLPLQLRVSDGTTMAWPILNVRLSVDPYSDVPGWNMPHAVLEPSVDDILDVLDPQHLAEVIQQVRAHCDRLDGVLAQLIAVRAEYGQLSG